MARPIRIEYPGAVYHVIQRGFRREKVLGGDRNKTDYLFCLEQAGKRFSVDLLAFCLMDNHVHLLVHTRLGNLSRFMHAVNAGFANSRKRFRSLDGPVFAGRYKALLVDRDAWLLQVSLYIHLNPLRARMKTNVIDYPWSSAREYLLDGPSRFGVDVGPVLSQLHGVTREARRCYAELLAENEPGSVDLPAPILGTCYGECPLAETLLQRLQNSSLSPENSKVPPLDPSAETVLRAVLDVTGADRSRLSGRQRNNGPRKLACYALRQLTSLTLQDIGDILDMNYHNVSLTARRMKSTLEENHVYQELWRQVQETIQQGVSMT